MRFSRVLATAPSGKSRAWRCWTLKDFGGCFGFCGALGGAASSAGFALGEVEDAGAEASGGHAEEGAAAGLFYVVAMGGDARTSTVLSAGDIMTGYSCIPP